MERFGSRLKVPDDGWLFAGSVLLLEPGTTYELRLTLNDPDGKGAGANVSRVLKAETRSEADVPASARQRHVVPGSGGGTGTAADPFRGLAVANKAAAPGDLFLLHSGVYQGPWVINRSGTPARPIVWRGLDGNGSAARSSSTAKVHPPAGRPTPLRRRARTTSGSRTSRSRTPCTA